MGSKLISNQANRANNSPRANRDHGSRPLPARRQGQFCLQSGQQPAQRCFIWEHDTTATLRNFDGSRRASTAVEHMLACSPSLALDYLSKMKIAVIARQLDLGHILWCGRVVWVERAHRVRVVRGVQKMPDVGNGVISFDLVRFHVRDLVMAFAV
jgi:hypothetical protein